MKTLIINAHPRFNNKDSFANQMQAMFLKNTTMNSQMIHRIF